VETGCAIRPQRLEFKIGSRLFIPTRPLIAIACLDCGCESCPGAARDKLSGLAFDDLDYRAA